MGPKTADFLHTGNNAVAQHGGRLKSGQYYYIMTPSKNIFLILNHSEWVNSADMSLLEMESIIIISIYQQQQQQQAYVGKLFTTSSQTVPRTLLLSGLILLLTHIEAATFHKAINLVSKCFSYPECLSVQTAMNCTTFTYLIWFYVKNTVWSRWLAVDPNPGTMQLLDFKL